MRNLWSISSYLFRDVQSIKRNFSFDPIPRTTLNPLSSVRWQEYTSAEAQGQKPVPSERVSAIVNEISNLTLLQSMDLTEVLRQKLEIGEMPVMGVMMPGMTFPGGAGAGKAAGGKGTEKEEVKTVFDVKLEGYDAAGKIKVIKEVRAVTDLGLKEAKDLVEKTPTLLKKGVTKEEAEKIIEKLKAVGAKVALE